MTAHTPGRRSFVAGALVLLLFGAVHLLAVYKSNFMPPEPGPAAELDRMAKDLKHRIGPFEASAFGLIQLLSASYSVLYAGATSLATVGPAVTHGRLSRLTTLNLMLAALLLLLTVLAQFPPPMFFAAVATILFAVSLIQQWRSRDVQIP
jgi:hypothetical protein